MMNDIIASMFEFLKPNNGQTAQVMKLRCRELGVRVPGYLMPGAGPVEILSHPSIDMAANLIVKTMRDNPAGVVIVARLGAKAGHASEIVFG